MDCRFTQNYSDPVPKRNTMSSFFELSKNISFTLVSVLNRIQSIYYYQRSYKSSLTPKEFMTHYITNNYPDSALMHIHLANIQDYIGPKSIRDLYPKIMGYREVVCYFIDSISDLGSIYSSNIYLNKLLPKKIRDTAELHELSHLSDASGNLLPAGFSSTYIVDEGWISVLDEFFFQPTDIYADYDRLYPHATPKNKLKIIKKINYLNDPTEVRARFIQSLARFDKRNGKLTRSEFETVWNEGFFGLKVAVKDKEKLWQFLQRDDVY